MANKQEVLSSVHNAIRILQEFSLKQKEMGISELSKKLGLAKSTVFRLVKTLKENNLVEQNEESQKYRLGIAAFELGFTVYHSMNIRVTAHPILKDLMKSTRKVVRLGVYDRGGVIYLCKVDPEDDYGTISKIGNRVPTYCTAVGRVLLAHQEEREVDRVTSRNLDPYTAKTITTKEKLLCLLKEVRQTGYAVTYEELRNGICSVSVPVYNDIGTVVAAISVTGLKSQFFSSQIQYYVKELRRSSKLITEQSDLE